ncbi:hypothetical protein SNOUR_40360 [Streptomyces noursei ATCC 11455]|nr:hypothetical protein SNOUR_40360 [Streptomyces noursei ATCC 11455]
MIAQHVTTRGTPGLQCPDNTTATSATTCPTPTDTT